MDFALAGAGDRGKNSVFAAFIEFVHISDTIPHVAKMERSQRDEGSRTVDNY